MFSSKPKRYQGILAGKTVTRALFGLYESGKSGNKMETASAVNSMDKKIEKYKNKYIIAKFNMFKAAWATEPRNIRELGANQHTLKAIFDKKEELFEEAKAELQAYVYYTNILAPTVKEFVENQDPINKPIKVSIFKF